jgi:hypothetical protein
MRSTQISPAQKPERHPAPRSGRHQYKVLATYKNGSFVQVIAKTISRLFRNRP